MKALNIRETVLPHDSFMSFSWRKYSYSSLFEQFERIILKKNIAGGCTFGDENGVCLYYMII